jgi:MoxR-like ATPase
VSQLIRTFFVPADLSPSHQITPLLPGLDKVKEEAVSYLRRTAFSSPRPLLITGGRGCGKTSIVKAIAAALEADRDSLSGKLFVSLSRHQLIRRTDIS